MSGKLPMAAAAAAFVFAATMASAQASLYGEIVRTRDGFVALRAAPDAKSKLLTRMKSGGEVFLADEQRNGWEKVKYWPANDRITKGESARTLTGWVNRKLVDACG